MIICVLYDVRHGATCFKALQPTMEQERARQATDAEKGDGNAAPTADSELAAVADEDFGMCLQIALTMITCCFHRP